MASNASVLLVEDEEPWQQILSDILQEESCTIQVASTYSEALGRFLAKVFDIVVIDLKLGPEEDNRDGVDLLKHAYTKGIPAIVVTGYGTPDMIRKARRYDAISLMHKASFLVEEFKQTVAKIVAAAGSKPASPTPKEVEDVDEYLRKLFRGGFL